MGFLHHNLFIQCLVVSLLPINVLASVGWSLQKIDNIEFYFSHPDCSTPGAGCKAGTLAGTPLNSFLDVISAEACAQQCNNDCVWFTYALTTTECVLYQTTTDAQIQDGGAGEICGVRQSMWFGPGTTPLPIQLLESPTPPRRCLGLNGGSTLQLNQLNCLNDIWLSQNSGSDPTYPVLQLFVDPLGGPCLTASTDDSQVEVTAAFGCDVGDEKQKFTLLPSTTKGCFTLNHWIPPTGGSSNTTTCTECVTGQLAVIEPLPSSFSSCGLWCPYDGSNEGSGGGGGEGGSGGGGGQPSICDLVISWCANPQSFTVLDFFNLQQSIIDQKTCCVLDLETCANAPLWTLLYWQYKADQQLVHPTTNNNFVNIKLSDNVVASQQATSALIITASTSNAQALGVTTNNADGCQLLDVLALVNFQCTVITADGVTVNLQSQNSYQSIRVVVYCRGNQGGVDATDAVGIQKRSNNQWTFQSPNGCVTAVYGCNPPPPATTTSTSQEEGNKGLLGLIGLIAFLFVLLLLLLLCYLIWKALQGGVVTYEEAAEIQQVGTQLYEQSVLYMQYMPANTPASPAGFGGYMPAGFGKP